MKKLWKFQWDMRGGNVAGLFVATDEQIDAHLDKPVSFGEVLGKHSDVYGTLERKDLTEVSSDPQFIEQFERVVGEFGYNPLTYMDEEEMD